LAGSPWKGLADWERGLVTVGGGWAAADGAVTSGGVAAKAVGPPVAPARAVPMTAAGVAKVTGGAAAPGGALPAGRRYGFGVSASSTFRVFGP
jgi:hypothetical protein